MKKIILSFLILLITIVVVVSVYIVIDKPWKIDYYKDEVKLEYQLSNEADILNEINDEEQYLIRVRIFYTSKHPTNKEVEDAMEEQDIDEYFARRSLIIRENTDFIDEHDLDEYNFQTVSNITQVTSVISIDSYDSLIKKLKDLTSKLSITKIDVIIDTSYGES